MLQPKNYPEMVGKALVFETEPFLTMVEDDNPWVEGLFFVTCIGVLLGVAHFIGGVLLTASLPPADAVRAALLPGIQQLAAQMGVSDDPAQIAADFRQLWGWSAGFFGYQSGLARFFFAILQPIELVLQWFLLALVTFVAARLLGGKGTLVKTLGTMALSAAPYVLGLLTIIPFVSVSGLLLGVWSLLIAYRAVAVSHQLSWPRAALAVLVGPILLLLIGAILVTLATFVLTIRGSL
jgi:hypothetical protein